MNNPDLASFTILQAMSEPRLWRGWFRNPESWGAWRAFLSVLFGLPLSADDLDLFRRCTGRSVAPEGGFTEAWLIVGRRGGKSRILALIACYLAIFRDWSRYLSPGETGTIKVLAADKRQARVIHRYARSFLRVPAIAEEFLVRDTDEEIILSNGVTIEIQAANFRSVRGYTTVGILADEIAFWRTDEGAASPDTEIINALRPAMATVPGAFFLAASSPYARRGELWNAFRRWHGDDAAPALVWHAETRVMNPTVPQRLVDEALAADVSKGGAEYLAQFRSDVESFVDREVVEGCVLRGVREIPPVRTNSYRAFVDPAGGSGSDSMALAIGHRDGQEGRVIIDCVREVRPKFNPQSVVSEFCGTLKAYRISSVVGDRFGGEWCREPFRAAGIAYEIADKSRSELYLEFLPMLNSDQVRWVDNSRIAVQLSNLERRTARSGKDTVDHGYAGHDDLSNVVAGVAVAAAAQGASWMELITDEVIRAASRGPRRVPGLVSSRNLPWLFGGY
jgi:hypothetical protein